MTRINGTDYDEDDESDADSPYKRYIVIEVDMSDVQEALDIWEQIQNTEGNPSVYDSLLLDLISRMTDGNLKLQKRVELLEEGVAKLIRNLKDETKLLNDFVETATARLESESK